MLSQKLALMYDFEKMTLEKHTKINYVSTHRPGLARLCKSVSAKHQACNITDVKLCCIIIVQCIWTHTHTLQAFEDRLAYVVIAIIWMLFSIWLIHTCLTYKNTLPLLYKDGLKVGNNRQNTDIMNTNSGKLSNLSFLWLWFKSRPVLSSTLPH